MHFFKIYIFGRIKEHKVRNLRVIFEGIWLSSKKKKNKTRLEIDIHLENTGQYAFCLDNELAILVLWWRDETAVVLN